MRRFWKDVTVAPEAQGWRVLLDGRAIRTPRGAAQLLPTQALAELVAGEFAAQGDKVDTRMFVLRDMADFAIDMVAPDPAPTLDKLVAYARTDTLCYRAAPAEPLFARQEELWEPLLTACEARHGVTLNRASGVIHCPQPDSAIAALRARLEGEDAFTLAALLTMASLAASLVVALAMLEPGADAEALFAAANAEEDWQAELWGWDWEAETVRANRLTAFLKAAEFARAAKATEK
ncbi:MAG: molecular chaperone [Erythrobacter sp.]|nr:molecular chaperone [Erythrobacter sp.]